MGNERATPGSQHAIGKQTLTSSNNESVAVPGKATLTEALEPFPSADLARVARRAGERVVDEGGFEYVAQSDGSFESQGKRISIESVPGVWKRLHDLLVAQSSDTGAVPQQGTSVAAQRPRGEQGMNWRAWLPWNLRDAERNEKAEQTEREEKNLVRSPVTGYGRPDQQVLGEDGQVKETPTSGKLQREEQNGTFSWLTGDLTWDKGSESYATDGGKRTIVGDSQTTTIGLTGINEVTSTSTRVEVVDVKATAAAAKKQLQAEKELAAQEIEHQQKGLVFKEDTNPAARKAAEARIAKLDAAIAAVDAAANNGEELKKLCVQHALVVEPKYKVVERTEVTEKNNLELELWKGAFEKTNEKINAQTDNAGVITTTTESTATSANFSEGKFFERETAKKEVKQNVDGTSERRTLEPTTKTSVNAGDGELKGSRSTTTESAKVDAGGKPISSSSATRTNETSLIAGDDGIGIKTGGGTKNVVTKGDNSTEKTKDGHLGITDKGLLGDGSLGLKQSDGTLEAQVKVSANGALLIEVLPPDEDSTQYRIVTTVRAGVGLSGSFGDKKEKDAKGSQDSVSGSVKGGATMVYTHAMTHAQVLKYLAEAERAEAETAAAGNGEFPEFGIVAKLKALAGEDAADPRSVFGNSLRAANMPVGDSMKLVLSGSVEAKLGVKPGGNLKGLGGDATVGASMSRTVTVAKDKDDVVVVTIGFVDTEKLAASLSGTLDGVSAKVGASQTQGDGDEYTFKLDLSLDDYQACYDTILGTWSRDTLKTLGDTEPLKSHIKKKKATLEHKGSSSGAIGGAGVMFNSGTSQQGASEISKTADGPEAKVSGGQSRNASISIADINIVGVTHTDTASASVDSKGTLSTDLQTANSETDLGTTLSNAGKTIKGWFGIKEGKETKVSDVLKGALEKTPAERLEELLEKQYMRLAGYKLREADVMRLVQRAEDRQKWMAACKSARALLPMEKLRDDLLSPNVDMSLVTDQADEAQIQRATKIAIAKALADFMESSGAAGMEAIVNVMTNWGARFTKDSTADDIGLRYEWPTSLARHRVTYEKAEKVVNDMSSILQKLIGDPNGKAKWHEIGDKLGKDLDDVHAAVAETRDMRSERARAEMLNDISRKKAALAMTSKYFDRAEGSLEKDAKDPQLPRVLEAQAVVEMFANERITTLLVDLAGLKKTEHALFTAGYASATSSYHKRDTHVQVRSLYELYELWVSMVKELRGHYTTLNADPRTWQVSSGPDATKHIASTEPHVERMINLWKTAGLDKDDPDFGERVRYRFGYY